MQHTGEPGPHPLKTCLLTLEDTPYREGAGRGQCCLRRVRKLIDAHVVSRWLATALGVVLQPSLVSSEALLVERGSDEARGMERGCLVNCTRARVAPFQAHDLVLQRTTPGL